MTEEKEKIDHNKPIPAELTELVNEVISKAQEVFNSDKFHGNMFFIISDPPNGNREVLVVDVTDLMKTPETKDKAAEKIREFAKERHAMAILHISESWALDPQKIRDVLKLHHTDKVKITEEQLNNITNSLALNLHELYQVVHGTIQYSPFTIEALIGVLDTFEGGWMVKFDIIREGENVSLKDSTWFHAGPLSGGRFTGLLPEKA